MSNSKRQPAPWHLWLVGLVALLWTSFGALNYVMTMMKNEAWLKDVPADQLEFIGALPTWVTACWAAAVWGGVLAALLLLMRKRLSVFVFLISLLTYVATQVYNYGMSSGMEVMGEPAELAIAGSIFVCSLGFFVYARTMKKRDVL